MDKQNVHIYTVDCYSAIKRNPVPIHATGINLKKTSKKKNLRKGERSQLHSVWFHLYEMFKTVKSIDRNGINCWLGLSGESEWGLTASK